MAKKLAQVLLIERDDFLHRNVLHVVVQIRVVGAGNDHELFVVAGEFLKGVFAEIQRMSFFTVDDQHGVSDFISKRQKRSVDEGKRGSLIPVSVRVKEAL